jgi:hypothetical protein
VRRRKVVIFANMALLAILEHTSNQPPPHRYTVVFCALAGITAVLEWASGRRRVVDTVSAVALLFTAVMNATLRRKR